MSEYKRLTKRDKYGHWYTDTKINDRFMWSTDGKVWERDLTHCAFDGEAIDRLAEFEDKIENGTLIELPYKLGTKLYFIVLHTFGGYFEIFETELWVYVSRYKDEFGGVDFAIEINDVDFDYETWITAHCYSTKAEAEAKLKELQEKQK